MNPELIAYIRDAVKNGASLYQVRTDLLAAGWPVEQAESHIRFVRENPSVTPDAAAKAAPSMPREASPVAGPATAVRKGPGCVVVTAIALILLFGSFATEGLLSEMFLFFLSALFWCWIIFWGGDARLEGSIFMGLLAFLPGATRWGRDTVRLFAWLSLLVGLGNFLYSGAVASQPRWTLFGWPDPDTRTLMGPNRAYWYEREFSTYVECMSSARKNEAHPDAVIACGRNCRLDGIMVKCKEIR